MTISREKRDERETRDLCACLAWHAIETYHRRGQTGHER